MLSHTRSVIQSTKHFNTTNIRLFSSSLHPHANIPIGNSSNKKKVKVSSMHQQSPTIPSYESFKGGAQKNSLLNPVAIMQQYVPEHLKPIFKYMTWLLQAYGTYMMLDWIVQYKTGRRLHLVIMSAVSGEANQDQTKP